MSVLRQKQNVCLFCRCNPTFSFEMLRQKKQVCCLHVSQLPVQIYYTQLLAGAGLSSGFKLAVWGFDPSGARGIFVSTPVRTSLMHNEYRVCLPRKMDRAVAWLPTPSCTEVLRMIEGIPLLHHCTFIACYGLTFTFNSIIVLPACRSFRSQFVVTKNVNGGGVNLRNLRLT